MDETTIIILVAVALALASVAIFMRSYRSDNAGQAESGDQPHPGGYSRPSRVAGPHPGREDDAGAHVTSDAGGRPRDPDDSVTGSDVADGPPDDGVRRTGTR